MNSNLSQDSRHIDVLVNDTCTYLRENLSYSQKTLEVYRMFWQRLSRFMGQNGYSEYHSGIGEEFLAGCLGENRLSPSNRYQKNLVRSIKYLNEFWQKREIIKSPESEDFSSNIGIAVASFLRYCRQENRLSERTLHLNHLYVQVHSLPECSWH